MTKQDLKRVILEAKKLRKFATAEERARLDVVLLYAASAHHCIYGQLTGYCYSDRAKELKIKSGYSSYWHFTPIEKLLYESSDAANAALVAYIKGESKKLTIEMLEQ